MTLPHALLSLALGVLCAAGSSAQSSDFLFARNEARNVFGTPQKFSFGQNLNGGVDLNGDGIHDYVGGRANGVGVVHLSEGGRFVDISDRFEDLLLADLVVDWNGDGFLDLVALTPFQEPVFLLGDGAGSFRRVASRITTPFLSFVVLIGAVDLDGSGGPELLVDSQTELLVLRLDPIFAGGSLPERFDLIQISQALKPRPIYFGPQGLMKQIDFDADGDPDLIDGTTQVYENLGGGVMRAGPLYEQNTRIPAFISQPTVVADFDGDGLRDSVRAALRYTRPSGTTSVSTPRTDGYAVAAADFDADGRVDLVWLRADQTIEILRNRPTATLPQFDFVQSITDPTGSLLQMHEVADFDGDGDQDLLLQGLRRHRLFLNDGAGSFDEVGAGPLSDLSDVVSPRAVIPGDFDGDGILDLVSASRQVFLRGVAGEFRFEVAGGSGIRWGVWTAEPGDIDGDGDLDLVGSTVQINDGRGNFADETSSRLLDDYTTLAFELADIDGDGDLDRIAYKDGFTRLFRNNGAGVFLLDTAAFPEVDRRTEDGAVLDVDGDGDLDLVVGDADPGAVSGGAVWLQNAQGVFVEQASSLAPALAGPWFQLDAGDIDRDGDSDLVVRTDRGLSILENRNGTFFASPISGTSTVRGWLTLVDLDGDGDLDLVADTLFLNNGFGRFSEATESLVDLQSVVGGFVSSPPFPDRFPQFADLDGDGDIDLLFPVVDEPGCFEPMRIATNRTTQLTLEGVSRTGGALDIRADVGLRREVLPRTVALYLSGASAAVPLTGLGTLRLDPTTLVFAGQATIPRLELSAWFALPIPNNPSLVGVELYAQALVVDAAGPARLTGLLREEVR